MKPHVNRKYTLEKQRGFKWDHLSHGIAKTRVKLFRGLLTFTMVGRWVLTNVKGVAVQCLVGDTLPAIHIPLCGERQTLK